MRPTKTMIGNCFDCDLGSEERIDVSRSGATCKACDTMILPPHLLDWRSVNSKNRPNSEVHPRTSVVGKDRNDEAAGPWNAALFKLTRSQSDDAPVRVSSIHTTRDLTMRTCWAVTAADGIRQLLSSSRIHDAVC